ncbi:Os05g0125050 [Oryza sativa Japonica Group]|uniref:Os05g0125050 protein n=1 Tax=Oryza sativa subsp. japonica TaxID=39947 RepID=A0A0P0WHC0_ORYSJ|nr:hypothetical protein EE612_026805 [Oryza sativa]BAS92059.1 Os05g0125050 [Oryza sativa Japonica Group]
MDHRQPKPVGYQPNFHAFHYYSGRLKEQELPKPPLRQHYNQENSHLVLSQRNCVNQQKYYGHQYHSQKTGSLVQVVDKKNAFASYSSQNHQHCYSINQGHLYQRRHLPGTFQYIQYH